MGIWNLTTQYPETFEIRTFWRLDFKGSNFQTFGNWKFLSEFQMIFNKMASICLVINGWASRFQIPFKIWPFPNQPLLDWSKSELVRVSDPYCIWWTSEQWKHLNKELSLVRYSNGDLNTGLNLVRYSNSIQIQDNLGIG